MKFLEDNTAKTLVICSIFICSVTLSIFYEGSLIPLCIFNLGLIILSKFKPYKWIAIAGLFVFSLGFFYSQYRAPAISDNDISHFAPVKNCEILGTVSSEPKLKSNGKLSFVLNSKKILLNDDWKSISGSTNITIFDKENRFNVIHIGQTLKVNGSLYLPFKASNPHQFDYSKYLYYKGITCQMYTNNNNFQILHQPLSFKYKTLYYLSLLKKHIQSIQEQSLSLHQAQLMGGIVLGERAIPMDKSIKQNFINSGLAHILAASGINVALLAFAWIFITSKSGLSHPVQYIGGMLIVIFYSLLTGLPPSVMRASIMLELILLGKLINKDANMLTIISFVATLLLIVNPYIILDIGFQLSFITTLGLIISIPVFQKYITKIPQVIAMAVLIPFIAQVWATPIILFNFNNFAAYSVIANFFAMPLVAIITYGGFLSSVVSTFPLIGSSISALINTLLAPVLSLLLYIAEYISHLPNSTSHFTINTGYEVILIYVIIGFILFAMWKECKFKHYLSIMLVLSILLSGSLLFNKKSDKLHINFFDVGNADCILITTPSNERILVDGGYRRSENNNSAKWVLRPYFYKQNIFEIDTIIVSHPQNDHIGGIPEILEDFKVHQYIDGGFCSKNKSYKKLLKLLKEKNIPYNTFRNKDTLYLKDNIEIQVLNPIEKPLNPEKHNINSLVLLLKYKNFRLLLTGDTEKKFINHVYNMSVNANVLKVGHHGSKKAIDQHYLNQTKPQIAIISSKKEKAEKVKITEQLLKKNRVKTYITGKSGAIEIITNGKSIDIKTFSKNHY